MFGKKVFHSFGCDDETCDRSEKKDQDNDDPVKDIVIHEERTASDELS